MLAPTEFRKGATGIIYKLNSIIVVKCPTIDGREDFLKENRIFDLLAQSPCPQLVTSFLRCDDANFLEYMPGLSLSERLQRNQIRNRETTRVSSVRKLEPLPLRKSWMKALAQGAAWLEALGLAHGDLRPENILLGDDDSLKIADFDCTGPIGSEFEACIPPYGRLLGSEGGSDEGAAGKLGVRTEQFALGSLFYYINYGFEVYDDHDFGKDHGPIVVERLQRMVFPNLNGDPIIDTIIDDCWRNKFSSIAALAKFISQQCDMNAYSSQLIPQEELLARQQCCKELLETGILDLMTENGGRERKRKLEQV